MMRLIPRLMVMMMLEIGLTPRRPAAVMEWRNLPPPPVRVNSMPGGLSAGHSHQNASLVLAHNDDNTDGMGKDEAGSENRP